MRNPTTNPKIDGRPMSFVRIGSRFMKDWSPKDETGRRLVGAFEDTRNQTYVRLRSGQIAGSPAPMCQVKAVARQTRLARRAAFRNLRYDLL
jgi:hypothetical protein